MDHQVKQLRGFSLKLKRFTSRHCRHRRSPEGSKKAGGRCLGKARPQSEFSILTEYELCMAFQMSNPGQSHENFLMRQSPVFEELNGSLNSIRLDFNCQRTSQPWMLNHIQQH
jgi:hypothetical protein